MKKLSFIIPNISSINLVLKITFGIFVSCLVSKEGYSQVFGCHIYTLTGSQQRVYYVPDHSRDFPNNSGWIATTPSYNTFDALAECIVDATSGCTVYRDGTTGTAPADILYSNGVESTLYSYACPIDDYIPALFIFTLGIAIVYIKRTPKLVNENKHYHGSI